MIYEKFYNFFKIKWFFHLILILFLIIFSLLLRLHTIDNRSLWMDECAQVEKYYFATSLKHVIDRSAHHLQPPLDYLIGYYFIKPFIIPFKDNELLIRLPSLFSGVLLVLSVYLFSLFFINKWVAILASLLSLVSNYLIMYSQEARPYSIFFFLLFLTLIAFFNALKNNTWKNWLFLTIVIYLLLLTRGLEPSIVLFTLNFVTICCYLLIRIKREQSEILNSKAVIKFVSISFITTLAYTPFLINIFKISPNYTGHKSRSGIDTAFSLTPLNKLFSNIEILTQPLSIFFLFLFIIGCFFFIIDRKRNAFSLIFLLVVLLLPIIHTYIFHITTSKVPFGLRYTVYTLPFIFIVSMFGLVRLVDKLFYKKSKYTSYVIAAIFIPIFIKYAFNLSDYYKTKKADYKSASRFILSNMNSQDVLTCDSFREHRLWQPCLYGHGVYYMNLKKYNKINDLVKALTVNPNKKGNVFMLLHQHTKENEILANKEIFENKQFYELYIIFPKKPLDTQKENLLLLLDEMIRFYPKTSSQAELYIAKANLLCKENPKTSLKYLKSAQEYVKNIQLNNLCKDILKKHFIDE